MADSDGSPQRDDRHHRRSRSRFPASSPEWTGETLAEREERRLAEAAVLVRPPLKQYGVLHPYPLPSLWRSSPGQIRNFPVDATAS